MFCPFPALPIIFVLYFVCLFDVHYENVQCIKRSWGSQVQAVKLNYVLHMLCVCNWIGRQRRRKEKETDHREKDWLFFPFYYTDRTWQYGLLKRCNSVLLNSQKKYISVRRHQKMTNEKERCEMNVHIFLPNHSSFLYLFFFLLVSNILLFSYSADTISIQ